MALAIVDLRSDTLTMPSAEMRRAMADAELGDDVFGEDPTVNRLQEVAAERLGKEAALFVASGTMGNLIGVLVSARKGEEIIADADSHVFLSEAGGAAALGGIQVMPVRTEAGVLTPAQVADAIRTEDEHHPRTAAVTFEDTHNYHGGIAWPLEALRAASDEAHQNGVAVHL
ncbi:MAG: low specificity L-threonine aldolase, partial [Chloroflexi bacterium]